jgi:serine/threonine-protein kinase
MSPEQISGREVDHRTDLFSLGVILYEMIALRRPFTGDNDAAVVNSVLRETPQPLARYHAEIPDELQRIVTKLLEKNKEFRYQSAIEVLSDLKRFMRVEISPRRSSGLSGRQRLLFVALPALVVVILVIALSTQLYLPQQEESPPGKLMLAVLPFENLGAPEDEYFADGMSEEITARLAGVHGLGIIARTSTKQYKNTDKPIRQIGEELGVDYILEGTVRWQKSVDGPGQVRITPQLIKIVDETHIWADVYDEVLTEVFFVQSTIARKVVEALNIALLEPERKSLAAKPTEDLEAYDYYLRGLEIYDKFVTVSEWLQANEMLEKAIELDSQFTLAYTVLSRLHSHYYWYGLDQSPERLTEAKKAADRALELAPDLPEAHLALGYYYYYGSRDLNRALQEFEIALEQAPNNSELLAAVGYIKRRLGNWEESYEQQKRAIEFDPASVNKRLNFVGTLFHMRKFDEAELYLNHNISLFPDYAYAYLMKVGLYLSWRGDVGKAREVLRSAPEHVSNASMLAYAWWMSDLFAGDYDVALMRDLGRVDTMQLAADSAEYYYSRAETHYLAGNQTESRIYYDSARVLLEKLQQREYQITAFLPPSLGVVYAGLDRKEDAVYAAREAVAQLPLSEDAFLGIEPIKDLALTYVRVGEYDLAIDEFDHLLSVPSDVTVAWLRHHPNWEPLRNHPRFQALLEKYK